MHHDVGLPGQLQGGGQTIGGFQVQYDAALVSVAGQVKGGHVGVLANRPQAPVGIAPRRLDFNDIGPHVAQHLAGQRPQHDAGKFHHLNAMQRSGHQLSPADPGNGAGFMPRASRP